MLRCFNLIHQIADKEVLSETKLPIRNCLKGPNMVQN